MRSDFVALILSHGRADNVKTHKTLRNQGYTGPIKILVDDEDEQLEAYRRRFGDEVFVFGKKEAAKDCDLGDNFAYCGTPLYARNQCHKIVKALGYRFFIELDDDYSYFTHKFSPNLVFWGYKKIGNLDAVFSALVDFLEGAKLDCVCMAQEGDFLGGPNGKFGSTVFLSRKIMNTFVCDVEKPFKFYGRFNDDVNAYIVGNVRGKRFYTVNLAAVYQEKTQRAKGGLTESYKRYGTYVKSFYSVMFAPTAVVVKDMGNLRRRCHHKINYNACCPKLLREDWRK